MSKIIKGYFYINPGYVNSTKREDFQLTFCDYDTDEHIESVLEDCFNDFLANVDMGWIIDEEKYV